MTKRDDVRNFKQRLQTYRTNLAELRLKEANYGLNLPTEISNEIRAVREKIAWHKYKIREMGGNVVDHVDDDLDGSFMAEVIRLEKKKARRPLVLTATGHKRKSLHSNQSNNLATYNDSIRIPQSIQSAPSAVDTQNSLPKESMVVDETTKLQEAIARSTIGIITALTKETVAVKTMLDNIEDYDIPGRGSGRRYIFGTVPARKGGKHHVVVTQAGMGNNQAAGRGMLLLERFPNVSSIIMVGIAGGFPNPKKPTDHVRLGDIVVSNKYGVIQYDFVKKERIKTKIRSYPRPPSASLLDAVELLQEIQMEGDQPWVLSIEAAIARLGPKWQQPDEDILYDAKGDLILHPADARREKHRPYIFISPIASSNTLLKNPIFRDRLRDTTDAKAAEMEASGIADATWNFDVGYLVVRGICDYCDSAKGDAWQNYAAVVAAAYTRALLACTPSNGNNKDYQVPPSDPPPIPIPHAPRTPTLSAPFNASDHIKHPYIKTLEENVPMKSNPSFDQSAEQPIDVAAIGYTLRQIDYMHSVYQSIGDIRAKIQEMGFITQESEKDLRIIIREILRRTKEIIQWVDLVPEYELCLSVSSAAGQLENQSTELKKYVIEEDFHNARIWASILQISIETLENRLKDLFL